MGNSQDVGNNTSSEREQRFAVNPPGDSRQASAGYEEIPEDAYKQNHIYRMLKRSSGNDRAA